MTTYKYTDNSQTVVHVIDEDGVSRKSCLASTLPADVFIIPADVNPEDYAALRKDAYLEESDPLFFKWQRGEVTEQDWLAKVAEIKSRYPM